MVKEAGAEYVIVGHSERRRLFGETDAGVNRKTIAALGAGPDADRLHRRDARGARAEPDASTILDRQIKDGLDALTAEQVAALVIAYEPVWAIGTGRNATPEQAAEAHAHIRGPAASVVRRRRGRTVPRHLRRQREAGQYPGPMSRTRRRRRARRRREPGRARLP